MMYRRRVGLPALPPMRPGVDQRFLRIANFDDGDSSVYCYVLCAENEEDLAPTAEALLSINAH